MPNWDNIIFFSPEYIHLTFVIRKRRQVVPVILQQQPDKNGREVILRNQREFFEWNDKHQLG